MAGTRYTFSACGQDGEYSPAVDANVPYGAQLLATYWLRDGITVSDCVSEALIETTDPNIYTWCGYRLTDSCSWSSLAMLQALDVPYWSCKSSGGAWFDGLQVASSVPPLARPL
jgi:hypothetical protein